MQLVRHQQGFTLTELAVVFAIMALLIGSGVLTLSTQLELRNHEETKRQLNIALDALIGYAIVNRRLPCPATAATSGDEAPAGGGACTTFSGFLPARTIGFQPTDADGYGVDVWGNRIRYAVSGVAPTGCTGTSVAPHFTSQANLKANGLSCRPSDIDICTSGACTARVVSQTTAVLVVFSTGKNGAAASTYGPDELENTDADAIFVSRTPGDSATAGGAYDDLLTLLPVGVLYSKLIAAGVLP
jgi:prepilin-type N-terminal cleavage/methylation domain-containing protein